MKDGGLGSLLCPETFYITSDVKIPVSKSIVWKNLWWQKKYCGGALTFRPIMAWYWMMAIFAIFTCYLHVVFLVSKSLHKSMSKCKCPLKNTMVLPWYMSKNRGTSATSNWQIWMDEINQDGVISILLTNDRSSPECQWRRWFVTRWPALKDEEEVVQQKGNVCLLKPE